MVDRHHVRILASPIDGVAGMLSSSSQHFERHWHNVYSFGFILAGAQKWRSGRGMVRGYEGNAICTNPGEVHDGEPLGGSWRRWFIVSVDVPVLRLLSDDVPGEIEFRSPVMDDPALVVALRHLFEQLQSFSSAPAGALVLEETITSVCTAAVTRHASSARASDVAAADMHGVRDRLADDLRNPPTLAELADLTGLSRFQTLRRFTKFYGLPPHAWLRNARVERARVLIRNGMPLSFAAEACGFADQSHMTRCFKRHLGTTPAAARNHRVYDDVAVAERARCRRSTGS